MALTCQYRHLTLVPGSARTRLEGGGEVDQGSIRGSCGSRKVRDAVRWTIITIEQNLSGFWPVKMIKALAGELGREDLKSFYLHTPSAGFQHQVRKSLTERRIGERVDRFKLHPLRHLFHQTAALEEAYQAAADFGG